MLAAENGHKDVVLFLTQKGANLDLVNEVSVHVYMLYVSLSHIFFCLCRLAKLFFTYPVIKVMIRLFKSF